MINTTTTNSNNPYARAYINKLEFARGQMPEYYYAAKGESDSGSDQPTQAQANLTSESDFDVNNLINQIGDLGGMVLSGLFGDNVNNTIGEYETNDETITDDDNDSSGSNTTMWIVIAILMVIAISIAMYFIFKSKKK